MEMETHQAQRLPLLWGSCENDTISFFTHSSYSIQGTYHESMIFDNILIFLVPANVLQRLDDKASKKVDQSCICFCWLGGVSWKPVVTFVYYHSTVKRAKITATKIVAPHGQNPIISTFFFIEPRSLPALSRSQCHSLCNSLRRKWFELSLVGL